MQNSWSKQRIILKNFNFEQRIHLLNNFLQEVTERQKLVYKQLTVNVEQYSFADNGKNSVRGNAEKRTHVISSHFVKRQGLSRILIHWNNKYNLRQKWFFMVQSQDDVKFKTHVLPSYFVKRQGLPRYSYTETLSIQFEAIWG